MEWIKCGFCNKESKGNTSDFRGRGVNLCENRNLKLNISNFVGKKKILLPLTKKRKLSLLQGSW